VNIKRRTEGKAPFVRIVRWRTALYAAIIVAVGAVMLYTLATRQSIGVNVLHDRNPLFVRMHDGAIRNAYTVRVLNKTGGSREFWLTVDGLDGSFVDIAGEPSRMDGNNMIEVGPDQTREVRVLVTDYSQRESSVPITFVITDRMSRNTAAVSDYFRGP